MTDHRGDPAPHSTADDRGHPPVVLVSNRGPISFSLDDAGRPEPRRGAGGLVSGLGPLVVDTPHAWIAAALGEGDRVAAADGMVEAEGFRVRTLAVDRSDFAAAYDVVCNATLWFVHHGLFEAARRPRLDRRWGQAWEAYRRVNRVFADAVAEDAPEGAVVLVQDYHLCLVASTLADLRPDLRCVHFSHTPFAGPDDFRALPDAAADELLAGMADHVACGFHSRRWAERFEASCAARGVTPPATFVSPLTSDPDDLTASAALDATAEAGRRLDEIVGDRRFLVRVDRIELSKNLLRGFWAFDELLEQHPEWRGNVVFGAFVYPSREGLVEYLAYRQEVETTVAELNERWGTDDWTPILSDMGDDYPRSVAALGRYDVLLVNPVRDGLNLVAKEGALLNQRDGAVVLSTEAGVYDELAATVEGVNPFDVSATAEAIDRALRMPADERRRRAAELRRLALGRTPGDWFDEQVQAALGRPGG
ncbi:MAG: trehalose-6-phosphate synthase [Acidimicrobiia bacterium]|nr:trehalose-6-phosphate synthase [Acidimicrobiia bacterium]